MVQVLRDPHQRQGWRVEACGGGTREDLGSRASSTASTSSRHLLSPPSSLQHPQLWQQSSPGQLHALCSRGKLPRARLFFFQCGRGRARRGLDVVCRLGSSEEGAGCMCQATEGGLVPCRTRADCLLIPSRIGTTAHESGVPSPPPHRRRPTSHRALQSASPRPRYSARRIDRYLSSCESIGVGDGMRV